MRKIIFWKLLFIIASLVISTSYAQELAAPHPIQWQEWSRGVFDRAKAEHKLVLVFGRVSWCHWCQLMASSTFADPTVEQIVNAHYLPIQVDIEAETSLANHYQITDLPTVLVVDDEDRILKKFTGYYPSGRMARSLQALVRD